MFYSCRSRRIDWISIELATTPCHLLRIELKNRYPAQGPPVDRLVSVLQTAVWYARPVMWMEAEYSSETFLPDPKASHHTNEFVRLLTQYMEQSTTSRARSWPEHATGPYPELDKFTHIQIRVPWRRGYVLRNASLGDFVVVRTSYSVLTQT